MSLSSDVDSEDEDSQGVLYLFPESSVAVSTAGGQPTPLKVRLQVIRTNERLELKSSKDCPILSSFDGVQLTTKSSFSDVLSAVKEHLSETGKSYVSLGGSGNDSLGVRAKSQAIDPTYNDFSDDAYDALSVSLVGRSSAALTIITSETAWQASLAAVGLRFSGAETLKKNADLRFVLIDVVTSSEATKGATKKKAKTISEKDVIPTFAKVVLRELTVIEKAKKQTPTTAKFGQIFILPIFLPTFIDGEEVELSNPEAIYTTMDVFRVAVLDAYFKQKCTDPIGKTSKLYMSCHAGRCSMEEISSTSSLVTMLMDPKMRTWVEPSVSTAVEVQCSFGHMVSGGERADQEYVDTEKTRESYVAFKTMAGPILDRVKVYLPASVARMSSVPSTVTLDDNDMSQNSFLSSPEQKGNASSKSISSATRPAAIERLILALNVRPDSPFHHGINHIHASIWASQLLTRLPITTEFDWLDKETLTVDLLRAKGILIDWVPHLARCGSAAPKKGDWVPEDATVSYKILKGSKEVKTSMSTFEEAIVGALNRKSSSGPLSTSSSNMLNIKRIYTEETHPDGKAAVSTCVVVNAEQGETLKTHLERVKVEDAAMFARLFHCGAILVADVEAQYSIDLNSSGGERHVRPYTTSTIQSVPMSAIIADSDVARPLTLTIVLKKKEEAVPADEVMAF
jgi:hypothetical protein